MHDKLKKSEGKVRGSVRNNKNKEEKEEEERNGEKVPIWKCKKKKGDHNINAEGQTSNGKLFRWEPNTIDFLSQQLKTQREAHTLN